MSRPLFDLMTYVDTNLVFATINTLITVGSETLTADPSTSRRGGTDSAAAYPTNGHLEFIKEERIESLPAANYRNEVWRVEFEIQYDSSTDGNDEAINAILEHVENLMDVNNNTNGQTWDWDVISAKYNEDPLNGVIKVVVKCVKDLESATS